MADEMYGIYDTQDDCWIGDEAGPKLFPDFLTARVAAQIYEGQLFGTDLGGRLKALDYGGGATQLRDEMAIKCNALRSLRRIECSNS